MNVAISIVLYHTTFSDCITLISLNQYISSFDKKCLIIIYDNSPSYNESNNIYSLFPELNIIYIPDCENGFLVKAYNASFNIAMLHNKDWIILMDQDTSITSAYLESLRAALLVNKNNINIVSVIPFLQCNNKVLSPTIMHHGGFMKSIYKSGVYEGITAFNSLNCIRVSFLKNIGGFSAKYKLDMLDHFYFRELRRNAKSVLVLPVILSHDLSICSSKYVDIERYKNIISSECLYFLEESLFDKIIFRGRLLFRSFKFILHRKYLFFKITFKYFVNY